MALDPISSSSVPSPHFGWQLWLLCASLSMGFFSLLLLLAYYYLAVEEDDQDCSVLPEVYRALSSADQQPVNFPQKEDKLARFKRWARCLRRQPPPAKPPIKVCHVEVNLQVAIEAFSTRLPATAAQRSGDPPSSEPAQPSHVSPAAPHQGFRAGTATTPTAGNPRASVCQGQASPGPQGVPCSPDLGPMGEVVRARILQFLLQAGPPSRLCAISEADDEAPSPGLSPSAARCTPGVLPRPEMGGRPGVADAGKATSNPAASSSWTPTAQQPPLGASPGVPLPLLLDGEEVLRVGAEAVPLTREVLWAALARIPLGTPTQEKLETVLACT